MPENINNPVNPNSFENQPAAGSVNQTGAHSFIPPGYERNADMTHAEIPNQESQAVEESQPEVQDPSISTPSLKEDMETLKKIHLLSVVSFYLKYGFYPSRAINELLKRRMQLDYREFEGPFVIRIVVMVFTIFFIFTLLWGVLWLTIYPFNVPYFLHSVSTFLASLCATLVGVFVFQPLLIIDEKKLKQAINERMEKLQFELESES